MKRNDWRGSAASRGYDRQWRKVRAAHLAREPLCRICKTSGIIEAATVVDHIQPIRERPDLRLDPSNLRSLCKTCHDRLNARQEAAELRGCDAQGNPTGGW